MRITVCAVGKIKEKFFEDAVAEYKKRISRYADFSVIALPDANPQKSVAEQQYEEGEGLLEKAKGVIIALDGGGKQISSEGLAELICAKCNEGKSEFSFLIGGSHGHGERLKKQADEVLSFGKVTFPHQLFRVVLCEQIYRALSIIAGTPYHK